MRTSESLSNIAPALVACLGEIEGAYKDGANPAFKRDGKALRYTTLDAVIEASREVLTKHGLGLMQFPGALTADGKLSLETVIIHTSGEWVSGDFQIAVGRADPQGVGSAITYARRYAQKAALNIPDVDDDAETAMGRGSSPAPVNDRRDIGVSPEGEDFWQCDSAGMSAHAAKKEGLDLVHDRLRHEASELPNREGIRAWIETNLPDIRRMPRSWRVELRNTVDERATELGLTNEKRAA